METEVPERFLGVLAKVHDALISKDVDWVLGGSLGLVLRGIALAPHDMDIVTDRQGAYEVEKALSKYSKLAVSHRESERLRSFFGMLEIDGVNVEVMGDLEMRGPDGRWEPVVDLGAMRYKVLVGGRWIPMLSLEAEYRSYLKLERADRAEAILRHIQR